jgi:hypothetical protein
MESINRKEIIDILSKIEQYEREESELVGQKQAILKQIQEEFGVKTKAQAESKLDQLDTKNEKHEMILEKKVRLFKHKYKEELTN